MGKSLKINSIVFFVFFFLFSWESYAQTKYLLDNAKVSFFSKAPLENIEAHNPDCKGVIDFENKEFAFKIPIQSFKFEKALMQEHFNENYMESDKFPESIFKGKIEGNFNLTQDGEYNIVAKGSFSIHGVEKNYTIPAKIIVKAGSYSLQSVFKIKLVDHHIEVPTLLFQKIAEEVEVKIDGNLKALGK